MRQCNVDPGQQLITVVRKGSRAMQQVPASADAFVWLRLYQEELRGKIPRGRAQPVWWTLRQPLRPLTYHAAHRMFERANAVHGAAIYQALMSSGPATAPVPPRADRRAGPGAISRHMPRVVFS